MILRKWRHGALGSSIDGSSQSTCLPGEMESEIKVQEVFESLPRNFTNGALTDAREDCIQEFGEKGCSNPRCAIWNNARSQFPYVKSAHTVLTSKDERASDNPNGFTRSYFEIKGVYYSFKQGRDLDVQQLRVRAIFNRKAIKLVT